jgi:hypothetical protein
MSKAFDTVNIPKLNNKLLHTDIPPTVIKFTANYLKGRKAFTLHNNSPSSKMHLKTGVPQGSVLSPTLFNIYTADIPRPPPNTQLDCYADDMNTLTSHRHIATAQTQLQPYLDQISRWTTDNNLLLNPDKSSATLFTPDPAEYNTQLALTINNVTIPTTKNPKVLGVTLDPKLNFSKHIELATEKAKNSLSVIKSLTTTKWGKSKETITSTFKALTRPILEYSSTIWSPIISDTSITKLQTIQNTALRIATGCTADTNNLHLHHETQVLPIKQHLQLHASLYKEKTLLPEHPLHTKHNQPPPSRKMKSTIFHQHTPLITPPHPQPPSPSSINQNCKTIHSTIVQDFLDHCPPCKITNTTYPNLNPSEENLPRHRRVTLAQLRTNKSPFLNLWKHTINPTLYPSPNCTLCPNAIHDTNHLFTCPTIPTHLTPLHLWTSPQEVSGLLDTWEGKLAAQP